MFYYFIIFGAKDAALYSLEFGASCCEYEGQPWLKSIVKTNLDIISRFWLMKQVFFKNETDQSIYSLYSPGPH